MKDGSHEQKTHEITTENGLQSVQWGVQAAEEHTRYSRRITQGGVSLCLIIAARPTLLIVGLELVVHFKKTAPIISNFFLRTWYSHLYKKIWRLFEQPSIGSWGLVSWLRWPSGSHPTGRSTLRTEGTSRWWSLLRSLPHPCVDRSCRNGCVPLYLKKSNPL